MFWKIAFPYRFISGFFLVGLKMPLIFWLRFIESIDHSLNFLLDFFNGNQSFELICCVVSISVFEYLFLVSLVIDLSFYSTMI